MRIFGVSYKYRLFVNGVQIGWYRTKKDLTEAANGFAISPSIKSGVDTCAEIKTHWDKNDLHILRNKYEVRNGAWTIPISF